MGEGTERHDIFGDSLHGHSSRREHLSSPVHRLTSNYLISLLMTFFVAKRKKKERKKDERYCLLRSILFLGETLRLLLSGCDFYRLDPLSSWDQETIIIIFLCRRVW